MGYGDTYRYECTNNHQIETPYSRTTCPAMVHGQPCDGELKRVQRFTK